MGAIQRTALALVIIGAINWGLIGFFRFDLVSAIFGGQDAFLSRVIFGLVGISGLACLAQLFKPMEEVEVDSTRHVHKDLNYNTEFGEEPDFTKPKEPKKKKPNVNKHKGNTPKKK